MDEMHIPNHIGIIMDGNGRWAKKRLMPRSYGHNAGMNRMIELAEYAQSIGIKYMTVYALSTENMHRPKEELDGLFKLIRNYFESNVKKLYKQNAAVKVIGDFEFLPDDVVELLRSGEENSPKDAQFTLIFAINYGSRREIITAVNRAIAENKKVDEESFSKLLYTSEIPDPDLIIRTGGEIRLSNFLCYQSVYSELYFTDTLFPDFTNKKLDIALKDFSARSRRFGRV